MQVRALGWMDYAGLFALRLNRYQEIAKDPNYGMVSNPSAPTAGEFAAWFGELHRAVLEDEAVCSVAEDGGRVVGMCSVRREGAHRETRHVGVLGIEVLAGFFGRGIGSALLLHALEGCRGRFEDVHLSVIPENQAAYRLYRKFGFEEYGRSPRAFQRAGTYHDFILMRKQILPSVRSDGVDAFPPTDRARSE
jgi:ribosomal protein S18 acetylase RimI-like enzyme